MSNLSLVTGKPRHGWSVPTKDKYFARSPGLPAEQLTVLSAAAMRLPRSAAFVTFTVPAVQASPLDAGPNRWLTAKWPMPRKVAGTAAERDGSTVGRVVVDGAITEDGGEVRHHGHQLGGIGESTAGGRGHLQAPEPSLRSAGSLWSQPCRCDNEEAPSLGP